MDLRHRQRRRPGFDAAAILADVDLDEYREPHAEDVRGRIEVVEVGLVIHADHDLGLLRQRREPSDLPGGDDLVGDQDVAHAAEDHRLGLAQCLAADSHGPSGDLVIRDDRALVRLGMGTEPYRVAFERIHHPVEVPLVSIEVDHEGRRLDVGDRARDTCWRYAHRAGSPFRDADGDLRPVLERTRQTQREVHRLSWCQDSIENDDDRDTVSARVSSCTVFGTVYSELFGTLHAIAARWDLNPRTKPDY